MGFHGIPGHEFVGVIEHCGKKKNLVGKRVVGEINIGCERCVYCRKGMRNHCRNRSVLGILNRNGAFAEYLTLPVKNLHPLPETVASEDAVFVEPLAAAFEITRQINTRPYHKVCVLGDGKLGLLAAQTIQMKGCPVTLVGKHRKKLSILKNRRITKRISFDLKSADFDFVIDCTGSPDGINTAFQIVRPQGTVVLKTTTTRRRPFDFNDLVINEVSLVGSRCGPFLPAIQALEQGMIDVNPLISKVFSFKDAKKAFHYASRRGVLKVILQMNPAS
jgi:threonine dehydrogenase-like Zn-dependent dehydrogenase